MATQLERGPNTHPHTNFLPPPLHTHTLLYTHTHKNIHTHTGTPYHTHTLTHTHTHTHMGTCMVHCTDTLSHLTHENRNVPLTFRTRAGIQNPSVTYLFIIIINPLTATVVGAPQMILQPVFSIFPCSPLPSGTCRTSGLSSP